MLKHVTFILTFYFVHVYAKKDKKTLQETCKIQGKKALRIHKKVRVQTNKFTSNATSFIQSSLLSF